MKLGSYEVDHWLKTSKANPNASIVVPLRTPMTEVMVPRRLTWDPPYWITIIKDRKIQ
jgi:hypothetical protein